MAKINEAGMRNRQVNKIDISPTASSSGGSLWDLQCVALPASSCRILFALSSNNKPNLSPSTNSTLIHPNPFPGPITYFPAQYSTEPDSADDVSVASTQSDNESPRIYDSIRHSLLGEPLPNIKRTKSSSDLLTPHTYHL